MTCVQKAFKEIESYNVQRETTELKPNTESQEKTTLASTNSTHSQISMTEHQTNNDNNNESDEKKEENEESHDNDSYQNIENNNEMSNHNEQISEKIKTINQEICVICGKNVNHYCADVKFVGCFFFGICFVSFGFVFVFVFCVSEICVFFLGYCEIAQ